MEAEGDLEKALSKAEREYREGKGIVCIPYGTSERFDQKLNVEYRRVGSHTS